MNISSTDMRLLKKQLTGDNLKKLLFKKGLKKYSVARDCGITYLTLLNWQKETVEPSDEYAKIVGRYLGLIDQSDIDRFELAEEVAELNAKIKRLS